MMARNELYAGDVISKEGFYIGDICYALSDEVYHGIWGDEHHFEDGKFEDHSGIGFAVGSTAYGDGVYTGTDGFDYGVDVGVIGIVPLELVKKDVDGLGTVHRVPGTARYQFENGVFDFTLPDGKKIHIETEYDEDDESDEWDGFCEDDEDEEDDFDD